MIVDQNKGITSISYNYLNLPTQITFENESTISYIYDASGVKIEKQVNDSSLSGTANTYYAGNYIYTKNNTQTTPKLTFFNTEEGYVEPVFEMTGGEPLTGGLQGTTPIVEILTGFEYTYQYKDHLGNIRLSYQDLDGNGAIDPTTEIKEENHYYPFGLKHKGYNNQITGRDHQYGYNGKEEQNELGLEWQDYGARNYDASLGRWMNMDPLAEKYYNLSPYDYVGGNPIVRNDPTGMDWYRNKGGDYLFNPELDKDNAKDVLKEGEKYFGASGKVYGRGLEKGRSKMIDEFVLNSDGSVRYINGDKTGILKVGTSMFTLGGKYTVTAYDDRPDVDATVNGESFESSDGNTYVLENNKWIRKSNVIVDTTGFSMTPGTGSGYYASMLYKDRHRYIDNNVLSEAYKEGILMTVDAEGLATGGFIDWLADGGGKLKLPRGTVTSLSMVTNLFKGIIKSYEEGNEHDRIARKIKAAKNENKK